MCQGYVGILKMVNQGREVTNVWNQNDAEERRLKNICIIFFLNCILLNNSSCQICLGNPGFLLWEKGKEYKKQVRDTDLQYPHSGKIGKSWRR